MFKNILLGVLSVLVVKSCGEAPYFKSKGKKMDKLEKLFEMQKSLNKRIGVDTDSMNDNQRQEWILKYCRAMSQEIAELTDSVPWKWWAKYQNFDVHNAKIEIIDILHFWISLAQVAGLSADDIFSIYEQKNKVNFERQDSGYKEKDETDNKAIKV